MSPFWSAVSVSTIQYPTIVGISTFMRRVNFMNSSVEHDKKKYNHGIISFEFLVNDLEESGSL